jgi:hypothetical protein
VGSKSLAVSELQMLLFEHIGILNILSCFNGLARTPPSYKFGTFEERLNFMTLYMNSRGHRSRGRPRLYSKYFQSAKLLGLVTVTFVLVLVIQSPQSDLATKEKLYLKEGAFDRFKNNVKIDYLFHFLKVYNFFKLYTIFSSKYP